VLNHPRVKSIRAVLGYVWTDSSNQLETDYYLDTTNNAQIVLFNKIGSDNLNQLGNIFTRRNLKGRFQRPTVDTYFTLSDSGKPLSQLAIDDNWGMNNWHPTENLIHF